MKKGKSVAIRLNSVRMHPSLSLFSKLPGLRAAYLTPHDEVKTFAVFIHCSFKYRFKKCHIARESVLVLKLSLQFQIVSNTVKMYHLPSLFSLLSLHFQNCFKCSRNAPCTVLVLIFVCSSKSFQIVSECML